jgi:hypothetical protein
VPLCLARRANRGDGELLFGTADGAFGEAGGEVGGVDLVEGHGTGGEQLLEEVSGVVKLGRGGTRLRLVHLHRLLNRPPLGQRLLVAFVPAFRRRGFSILTAVIL